MRCTSVKELLKQGNQQFIEGQYQKSLETFQEIIGLEPENFQAWCTLGLAQGWLNQDKNAINSQTQALQIKTDYILALARRGVEYQLIGQAELAQLDLERAISVEPQNAEDWHGRSIALSELKRDHEALDALDEAIGIYPENPYFWKSRASILSDLKRDDEAIAAYDRALDICPRYLYCWYRLGIALYNRKDYEKAIVSFDKAIEIKPDDYYLNNWYLRGLSLANLSRYEEAIASFDRALEINSSNHNVWFQRAYALANLARYEEAIASYDQALNIQPDNYAAWLWRGCAFMNLQDFEQGLVSFERAIELNSNDYYGFTNRNYCLHNFYRYEEAISALNQVIEIKPDDSYAWEIRGYFLIGLGKLDDALDSYNNALALNYHNYQLWHKKANVLKILKRFEEAIDSYRQALDVDPSYFRGWYEYADTLYILKKNEEALTILNSLLERKSDYALAWSLKSFILTILERYEEACLSSDRALELDANNFLIWVERAYVMGDARNYEESLRSCEQALSLEPNPSDISWRSLFFTKPNILTKQGNTLMVLERFEEAISTYQKALAIDPATLPIKPDYLQIWNNCGRAFTKLRCYQEAFAAYDRSIELDSNQLNIWLERGKIALFLSQDDEALNSYDRALSIEPENIEALNGRVNSLDNLGRYQEALETVNYMLSLKLSSEEAYCLSFLKANLLKNLDRHQEALDSFYQILAGELGNKFAWFVWFLIIKILTKKYANSNDKHCREQIINACNNALNYLPNQTELDIKPFNYLYIDYFGRRIIALEPEFYEKFQALVWTERGLSLYALANYEEALDSLENALNFDGSNSLAWREKGNALFELKRYEQALDAYDTYLDLTQNDSDWLILMQRGEVLAKLCRYAEAVSSYRKAIEIEPKQHRLWHKLGAALDAIGQIEEALNVYQKSLKLDSQCKFAWGEQGRILANLYRDQESLASYDRAIALDSESADFHNGRGWALTQLRSYTEALAAYDQALQKDEQYLLAWRNRGWTIYLYRGLDEALEAWDEGLLKLKPEHPNYAMACAELHYFKGLAHDEQGKKQADCFSHWRKARNYYQRALRLLDGSDYRERYLDILKDLIKVLLGLGESDEANQLGREGTALLQRLLSETVDPLKQQQLALKYASFEQLTVDYYVQSGQLVKALETAETGKNTCLSWLLSVHRDEANSLDKQQVGQLLNPATAIVYWHLSPASLTTFILTSDTEIPAILPEDDVETSQEKPEELPQSYRQLLDCEAWVKNWNQRYTDYGKAPDQTARENHRWRTKMSQQLERLKQILKIPTIVAKLPSSVSQIILIPHRDLHRFPLHALFPDHFTLTYLPSLQMGLNLKDKTRGKGSISGLLSVEAPNNTTAKQHHPIDGLYAAAECQLIAQMFPTTTIQSDQATKEKVSDMLKQAYHGFHFYGSHVYGFHFSGHAAYNFNNPKRSALALTGKEHLTVEDICGKIPLVKDYSLVCLSACETAVTGNQTITSEYVGLVSGCLRGGAHNVVSTLWTVQSISSFLLMVKFYSLLKDGTAAAIALGEAQRWLRNANYQTLIEFIETLLATYTSLNRLTRRFLEIQINSFSNKPQDDRPFADPYHWTGFTLTGLQLQL